MILLTLMNTLNLSTLKSARINCIPAEKLHMGYFWPPNRDIASFNDKLCIALERIKKENKLCYLLGDYNINLLNHDSHLDTGALIDLLSSFSFVPLITRPTRVTATTATLIDNILTNNVENINHSDQGILVTDVTDHYPVFHIHRIPKDKETEVYLIKRIYSTKNKQTFLESIAETDWSEINSVTSTETAFNAFHDKLMKLLNKCFPKISVKKISFQKTLAIRSPAHIN